MKKETMQRRLMKTNCTILAAGVAALLCLSAPVRADSNMPGRAGYSPNQVQVSRSTDARTTYVAGRNRSERRIQEPSMAERMINWPLRAGHTVIRTPVIVRETLTGKRSVVNDEGRFFTKNSSV